MGVLCTHGPWPGNAGARLRQLGTAATYLSLHIRFRLDPDFRHAFVKRIQVFDIVVLRRYPADNLYDFWGRYGGILGWSGRDRTQAIARNPGHRGTVSRMSVAVSSRRLRRRGRIQPRPDAGAITVVHKQTAALIKINERPLAFMSPKTSSSRKICKCFVMRFSLDISVLVRYWTFLGLRRCKGSF